MKKFKGTQGEWKIRFEHFRDKDNGECGFFIEAKEPKNHIGKIEIMMEDYGEQSGYPREQRLEDAKLIAAAPKLLEEAIKLIEQIEMSDYIEELGHNIKYNKAFKELEKIVNRVTE